jgi:hypothetical protein
MFYALVFVLCDAAGMCGIMVESPPISQFPDLAACQAAAAVVGADIMAQTQNAFQVIAHCFPIDVGV